MSTHNIYFYGKLEKFSLLANYPFGASILKRVNGTPVSILRKSISDRHRPVRVADGPMTARCRFT